MRAAYCVAWLGKVPRWEIKVGLRGTAPEPCKWRTKWISPGFGLGAIGPGIGIGIACYGCCVATARQPELQGRLFTNFIIGAALAEALALIGLVVAFIM